MAKSKSTSKKHHIATRLVGAGREYSEHGMVNPAVYHASTVLYPTVQALVDRNQEYNYARRGTPSSRALESAVAELEGGHAAKICPSGLAAVTTTLLALLKTGDHLLVTDAVYGPTRLFCDTALKRLGIETTYYDPLIGGGIADLFRPQTRLVYCECPGSQTMDVQDVPAIVAAAHAAGCHVVLDNTWSGGRYFNAFGHGCDVSIQAATKYLVGHSDAMLGTITASETVWPLIKEGYETLGQFAGPDDMYLALRGIRTLDVRLERHWKSAVKVASWLRDRSEVAEVLYPALPGARGHELWKRDFTGASGLFSVILRPVPEAAVAAMLDRLELFGMGFSWGGYESLVVPFKAHRSVQDWGWAGPCLRFHIGLENTEDLLADLDAGFARLRAAA
jgi:cysteine-S-conjugate beta-lyase